MKEDEGSEGSAEKKMEAKRAARHRKFAFTSRLSVEKKMRARNGLWKRR